MTRVFRQDFTRPISPTLYETCDFFSWNSVFDNFLFSYNILYVKCAEPKLTIF